MPKGHRANIGGSAVGLPQQVSIAGMRHPAGASEMTIVDAPTAFGIVFWIESEQDMHRFCPIGAIGIRIQQACVELDVRLVVGGEFLPCRRGIFECLNHGAGLVKMRLPHFNQVWPKMERWQASAGFARRSARGVG